MRKGSENGSKRGRSRDVRDVGSLSSGRRGNTNSNSNCRRRKSRGLSSREDSKSVSEDSGAAGDRSEGDRSLSELGVARKSRWRLESNVFKTEGAERQTSEHQTRILRKTSGTSPASSAQNINTGIAETKEASNEKRIEETKKKPRKMVSFRADIISAESESDASEMNAKSSLSAAIDSHDYHEKSLIRSATDESTSRVKCKDTTTAKRRCSAPPATGLHRSRQQQSASEWPVNRVKLHLPARSEGTRKEVEHDESLVASATETRKKTRELRRGYRRAGRKFLSELDDISLALSRTGPCDGPAYNLPLGGLLEKG